MSVRLCAEIAVAVALAVVLGTATRLLQLPYGGSINLSGLPILVMAFRNGVRTGCTTGALYGVTTFLLNPYYVHPLQVLLDYPVAFGALGMAGGLVGGSPTGPVRGLNLRWRVGLLAGVLRGNGLRLAAHFVSGVVFFGHFAPQGQPVWLYSLAYNASYLVPETIIYILLLQTVLTRIIYSGR